MTAGMRGGAVQGKKEHFIGIETTLSFLHTPYSCQALPVPLCVGCWLYVQEVGSFVSSLLPVGVEHTEERNVCVDLWEGGRDNTRCVCE